MRSGDLLVYLYLNGLSNGIVYCSWCYFVQIQSGNLFSQKFNSCVTDERMDTPSCRIQRFEDAPKDWNKRICNLRMCFRFHFLWCIYVILWLLPRPKAKASKAWKTHRKFFSSDYWLSPLKNIAAFRPPLHWSGFCHHWWEKKEAMTAIYISSLYFVMSHYLFGSQFSWVTRVAFSQGTWPSFSQISHRRTCPSQQDHSNKKVSFQSEKVRGTAKVSNCIDTLSFVCQ